MDSLQPIEQAVAPYESYEPATGSSPSPFEPQPQEPVLDEGDEESSIRIKRSIAALLRY